MRLHFQTVARLHWMRAGLQLSDGTTLQPVIYTNIGDGQVSKPRFGWEALGQGGARIYSYAEVSRLDVKRIWGPNAF